MEKRVKLVLDNTIYDGEYETRCIFKTGEMEE